LQLAGHKRGERHLRRGGRKANRLAHAPAANPANVPGFLLPAQRGSNAAADCRFFLSRSRRPRVFTVIFERPPRKNMPLRQQIALAACRKLEAGEIFRRGAQAGCDEYHALRVNLVDGFDRFFVDAVKRGEVMVELVRRFVNQIESQQRRAFTEVVRHGDPPVNHLFFVIGVRAVFIFIGLIGNNRDRTVLLAGLDQLAQVDQPRFGRFTGDADTHVGDALRAKVANHQRIELADAALGAGPVDVHAHAELLRVARSRQRRLCGNGPAGRQHERSGNQRL
jgi:hypothetical protein